MITTDIIVGFPGETEEDFQETLKVVEQARFSSAFTFQYSIRPGTPAATMENQIPKEVVQERYERLIALQDRIAGEENRKQLGKTVELMVVAEAGRRLNRLTASRAVARTSASCTSRCPKVARLPAPATW